MRLEILKNSDELTILVACLGDCLSGLEDTGRDAALSSYGLLLEEKIERQTQM